MGSADLAQVLSDLPEIIDPNVLVGTKTADDAAVYRLSEELAIIQTVDFFTPVVDDPYAFGAIAAANALSDVYAMGGRPAFALNIVGFPRDNPDVPMSVLKEILRGGAEKAREGNVSIVGGHTVDDAEPKYGLCVTGFVHPDRCWTNVGARPSDRLVLTKPLGSGIVTTALRAGKAAPDVAERAIEVMSALNRDAAEAAAGCGVRACTDVTGFGLLGHLREMLSHGGVGARVRLSAVPVLDGALELAREGCIPGGTRRNAKAVEGDVSWDSGIPEEERLLLADAQTSGGLLFAVSAATASKLVDGMRAVGVAAVEVGEFVEAPAGRIEVVS